MRDQLTRQEVAALTVVDTYVRERLCFIRQHEEDIDLMLNQVNIVCNHISKAIRQDDARVILAASEIRQMIETVEAQQKQFAEINNEQLLPDASIPITFTKGRKRNCKCQSPHNQLLFLIEYNHFFLRCTSSAYVVLR